MLALGIWFGVLIIAKKGYVGEKDTPKGYELVMGV